MSTTRYQRTYEYDLRIDQTRLTTSSTYQKDETSEPYELWEPMVEYERGNSVYGKTYDDFVKGDERPEPFTTDGHTNATHEWVMHL